ncbi:MAG: ribosome-associated translation inhibitor RaiA [Hyphomicrobiaceae bacterium]|nr:ribosome-associated translation inhibitor RaiA [Hyphomicrobiaceae bacterium]
MALQVTGKNLDVGEALRSYIAERVETALEKYAGQGPTGHIRIEKAHGAFLTGCTIQLKSGLSLEAHGEAPDAYASVDRALERLEKRLRRYKRRLKKRHGPAERELAAVQAPYYVIQQSEDEETDSEEDNPIVIAETQTMIRELSVSDAVMQLDLAGRPLLLFQNAGHGRLNIVYRRSDGNIGWIDPGGQLPSAS